jgi:uncharacterized repeat protein (TIGR01451 family)
MVVGDQDSNSHICPLHTLNMRASRHIILPCRPMFVHTAYIQIELATGICNTDICHISPEDHNMQPPTPGYRTSVLLLCTLLLLSIVIGAAGGFQPPAARAIPGGSGLSVFPGAHSAARTAGIAASAVPRILLVDDDANDPDVRGTFVAALDGLGVAYDVLDTTVAAAEPAANALASYATVIWATGRSGYPDQEAEAALTDFLDSGKCLFVSSQEYLYSRGLTPFMKSYLGVASAADDVSAITVTGVGPVFGGIGPSALSLPYENRTDRVSPDASASVAFSGISAGPVDSAVQKDAGRYRTTFWGFGFEGLPTAAERQNAMQRVLSWCAFQADLSIRQSASPKAALRPGQPLTYTLSYTNAGVAIASGVLLTDTLPAALTGLSVTSSGPAISTLAGAPYRWQIDPIAPGASGTITITGAVAPTLAADVSGAAIARLATETFDANMANNSAQAAFDVVVPRVSFSSASYSVAEPDGAALITVTLDAPNPFADTSVAYATSDGTAQASSDYTARSGRLTIPAGQISAAFSVPIDDDTIPEAGETLQLSLSSPSGGALASQNVATLTIRASDGIAPPQIHSPPPPGARRGAAYSHRFAASGLPAPSFTLTAGALPPGLALSPDGTLSGTPSQPGIYDGISVTASNGMAPDATQSFGIVVAAGTHVYLPLITR